jgi:hypothetical protein
MKLALLIVVLCSVAVGGCGAGDDAGGGSPSGPTESEWRSKVTKACKGIQTDSQQVLADVQKEKLGERATAAEVIDRSVPIIEKRLDEMKAIEAPASLRKDYDAFVGKLAETVELFPRIADDTRPFATEHRLTECLTDQR